MSKKAVYGPFLFGGETANGNMYLVMLENWLMDKFNKKEIDDLIFQQDEMPLSDRFRTQHYQTDGLNSLGEVIRFSYSFLRSPYFTPCNSFLYSL